MSEQHTPGRLIIRNGYGLYTADGKTLVADTCLTTSMVDNGEANARRLVACWNLLADVPTEEIEAAANYGSSWGKTGLELAAVTAEMDALRTENARLRAELEAVGTEARMFKTRCQQLQSAMEAELSRQDDAATERDELLDALKQIANSASDMKFIACAFARAVIAKVEGGGV